MSTPLEGLRHLSAICTLALPFAAWRAGVENFQPTQVSATPDRQEGLMAFAQMERVLLHPHCVNCHVPDAPLQGDFKRMHYPPVQRGLRHRSMAAWCRGSA
jgi:mono/diheme cytochrome c family protein